MAVPPAAAVGISTGEGTLRILALLLAVACGVRPPGECATAWFADGDGDGFGDPSSSVVACAQPEGRVERGGDCDDGDPTVHPGGVERCLDGVDDDCSGAVDDAEGGLPFFRDDDGDGYGAGEPRVACAHPGAGWSRRDGDCDDGRADVAPGSVDACGDGVDADCDGRDPECGAPSRLDHPWVVVDGDAPFGWLGESVAAGDLDGDGHAEVVAGAPGEGGDGVAVVLDVGASARLDDALLVIEAQPGAEARLGSRVAVLGDVDGDGVRDLGLSTQGSEAHGAGRSSVFVVSGARRGRGSTSAVDARVALADARGGWWTGGGVRDAGDIDADGLDDLVLGLTWSDGGTWYSGAFLVLAPLPSVVGTERVVASVQGEDACPDVVALGAGDLDGDGHADLALGSPRLACGDGAEGGVGVVFGAFSGHIGFEDVDAVITGAGGAGSALATGGDLDGDGLDDLIVASPGEGVGGMVTLLPGPVRGTRELAEVPHRLVATTARERLGASVAVGGDHDGDGTVDLVVGAPRFEGDGRLGAVYLVPGPLDGVVEVDATMRHAGSAALPRPGLAVDAADVDGDGLFDMVIGALDGDRAGHGAGAVGVVLGAMR